MTGCIATQGSGPVVPRASTATTDSGWRSLADGRDADAASDFRLRVGRNDGDVPALFGDASLAFERGDDARAIASFLALLERASGAPDTPDTSHTSDDLTPLLAAASVVRLSTLLDEHPGPERDRMTIENRLLAISPARLPWEARYGLAMIGDRVGRRRGDPGLLERVARAAGCLRTFTVGRPLGHLPHVDLDTLPPRSPSPAVRNEPGRETGSNRGTGSASGRGRVVEARGCVVSVPTFDGRAGAQRIFSEIDVPGAGTYDIVLDFQGEARLIVDGDLLASHGHETRYGPRVSAARVALARGRHQLEFRLATFGGHPNIVAMVFPATVRQGDPASSPAAVDAALVSHSPGADLLPAAELAGAAVANRLGDAEGAWAVVERLEGRPRFALGLAVGAAVARDDPSRPANFGRDRARTLLSGAVALDPALARVRHALALIAFDNDRPREAVAEALAATRARPGWWPPALTLHAAYRARGLEWDADQALDQAILGGPGACPVIEAALGRAEERRDLKSETHFAAALDACGKDSDEQIERMKRRGDLAGVEAALRRVVALAPDRDDATMDLATALLARGQSGAAAKLIEAIVEAGDGEGQIRLADALAVSGLTEQARTIVSTALARHPEMPEIVRAARALGLPLPLDPFRLDGRHVIQDFEAGGHRYAAPAVVVLDRTVTRVFDSGAEMILTHEIVRVQSKDAIEKWGEARVPERSEILVLRTHKADGTTREPEELAGKETISAADLAVGDYVEKETLEMRPPRDAFLGADESRGGFLGDRFYFQSFDAPLDRSEYLLVTTADVAEKLSFDRRAGAPAATRAPGPPVPGGSGPAARTTVTTFAAAQVPQLFAERSSVPAIEHVPSVRVSIGVGWAAWSRFLREQLYGTLRTSPALQRAATEIRAHATGPGLEARAAALSAWVGQNVEADDDLRDSASFGVMRGRGNRVAVILALARLLGLDARPALARSRLTADGRAPAPIEEADDFSDALVRFEFAGGRVAYCDPRLKHAPFGYLPPGLDGARTLLLATAASPDRAVFEITHGTGGDHRAVDMDVRLDNDGGGVVEVRETLRGWPALEWAEIVDRFGTDASKVRQDFEQRWLGVHFPGAVLKDLAVEVVGAGAGVGVGAGAGVGVGAVASPGAVGVDDRQAAGRTAPPAPGSIRLSSSPGAPTAPLPPYAAREARLRYSFTSTRLALKRDHEIRFLPTFFRSQPGRRYAAEPRRGTTLLTGFDVSLDLHARVHAPAGAHFEAKQGSSASRAGARVIARAGDYRFVEERTVEDRLDAAPVLLLKREARLSMTRVSPAEYPAVADDLRHVDALEQEEVRIAVEPRPVGGQP